LEHNSSEDCVNWPRKANGWIQNLLLNYKLQAIKKSITEVIAYRARQKYNQIYFYSHLLDNRDRFLLFNGIFNSANVEHILIEFKTVFVQNKSAW